MADLRKQWSGRGRVPLEAHWPAVASYNRGIGNIIADQRACNDGRLWSDIEPCTARATPETPAYVRRITDYWLKLESKNGPQGR